jgi:hypothetical protein
MSNILAVQVGEAQNMGTGQAGGIVVDTGQRAILAVTFINADIQTTTFYGNSLYLIWYNVGQLDCIQAFTFFCKQFYNKSYLWWQLAVPPPNPLMASSQIYLVPRPPAPPPIASGMMTLLDSGYDPLKGYWLKFAGNYDNTCPVFKGYTGVNRNIPNYQIRQN